MNAPVVGVLALQGDVREHEHVIAACGARTARVRTVEDLAAVDALVIPGGESTTMSKLAVDFGLIDPLRKARASGMPMYGSCAGMIMLADRLEGGRPDQQTIGGIDMTVRRNAFGRQVDSFEADLAMPMLTDGPGRSGRPEQSERPQRPDRRQRRERREPRDRPGRSPSSALVHAVFIRAPWVESVGDGVEVLGRVETGPAAGRIVAVRQDLLMATSFHPELTGDYRVHEYFVDLVRAAV